MNDLEFVALSRTFATGDLVLFSPGAAHRVEDGHGAENREERSKADDSPTSLESATDGAVGAGFVLRFVDPAKPLLVYRNTAVVGREPTPGGDPSVGMGIDFFLDVLYATTPRITADRFAVWRTAIGREGCDRWISYLETVIGRALRGDTPLFDAYSSGALGVLYTETDGEVGLYEWITAHLNHLGGSPRDLGAPAGEYAVWEGHDVYTFA